MIRLWKVGVALGGLLVAVAAYARAAGPAGDAAAGVAEAPAPMLGYDEVEAASADALPSVQRDEDEPATTIAAAEMKVAPVAPAATVARAPVPMCTVGYVTLIMAARAPYGLASITGESGVSELVGVGEWVGEAVVKAISWDRVVLAGADGRCQMRLGHRPAAAPKKKRSKRRRRKRSKHRPEPVPDYIADKISQLGPNRFAIQRAAFDEVFEMKNGLVRGTRVRPVKNGAEVVGLRLTGRGVADGSLLHSIGVRSGDVIKTVNGFDISDPQKALQAYGRLRAAGRLTLEVERAGKPQRIDYEIQ